MVPHGAFPLQLLDGLLSGGLNDRPALPFYLKRLCCCGGWQAERSRVSDALNKLRAELDALRNKEGEAQRTLDAHQGEYSSLEAELAELEASRAEKVSIL